MPKRKPITTREIADLSRLLPIDTSLLYAQEGRCSACGCELTYSELETAVQQARQRAIPQEEKLIFLLVWCKNCEVQPLAKQLAIGQLTEAVRTGPHSDDVWITVAPDGKRYAVSEGRPINSAIGTVALTLYPFRDSDYPNGYGALNLLPWSDRYNEYLAASTMH